MHVWTKKSTTYIGRAVCSLVPKWPKRAVFSFQGSKNVGRERGLCNLLKLGSHKMGASMKQKRRQRTRPLQFIEIGFSQNGGFYEFSTWPFRSRPWPFRSRPDLPSR